MKVAFLTQWYEADGGGHFGRITEALAEFGCSVAVITGTKPYATSVRAGMGRRFGLLGRRSDVPGTPVVRYPFFSSHDQSAMRRFTTYGTFAMSSLDAVSTLRQADVVLAYGSPATAAAAAYVARARGGPPFVLMVQDVWPDSILATGFVKRRFARGLADKTVGTYVKHLYDAAAQVTAISPGMRDLLIERGARPDQTHVIYNWTDEAAANRVSVPVRGASEPLHLMYAGNMGPGQNLGNVLRALALLRQDRVRLTLVGDGADLESLRDESRRLHLGNVEFRGRVAREDLPGLLPSAHLHIVSLADTPVFRITLPSKLQALLAAGLPVLSIAPGEVGEIVSSNHAGLSSPPDDPQALALVIQRATAIAPVELAALGSNGSRLYWDEMSRERNAAALHRTLVAASESRRAPSRSPSLRDRDWVSP